MKYYRGFRKEPGLTRVMVQPSGTRGFLPLQHHVRHSPDGFEWGYSGSGPSELARCILWDFLGEEPSSEIWQAFRDTFITNLHVDSWELPEDIIQEWIDKHHLKWYP